MLVVSEQRHQDTIQRNIGAAMIEKTQRANPETMKKRENDILDLVNQGYTVREAGRKLGLTKHQTEHLAQTRGIQSLHGALSEAKSEAAIKGNQIRWGS